MTIDVVIDIINRVADISQLTGGLVFQHTHLFLQS